MAKVMTAIINVRKGGGCFYEIKTPSGKSLVFGGTRTGKKVPPDPIKIVCRAVEKALKRGGRPSFSLKALRRRRFAT